MRLNLNVIGILSNHQVLPMIIMENRINMILNLILITNIKIIFMIEKHNELLPEMCMIGKKWKIEVSFIVV